MTFWGIWKEKQTLLTFGLNAYFFVIHFDKQKLYITGRCIQMYGIVISILVINIQHKAAYTCTCFICYKYERCVNSTITWTVYKYPVLDWINLTIPNVLSGKEIKGYVGDCILPEFKCAGQCQ